jgi:hypothetical protein
VTTRELLSMRAYARHRADVHLPGASHPAVRKAIATGRLSRALVFDGNRATPLIDVAIADQEWRESTDPMQSRLPDESAGPGGGTFAGLDERAGQADPREQQDPSLVTRLRTAQLVRLTFQSRIAQLEAMKMGGELVSAKDVAYEQQRLARSVRDTIRALPDTYAPQLAAETDPHRCRMLLASAIDQALTAAAEQIGQESEAVA